MQKYGVLAVAAVVMLSGCGGEEQATTDEVHRLAAGLINEIEQLKDQARDAEETIEELERRIDLLESNLGYVEEKASDIESRVSIIEISRPD